MLALFVVIELEVDAPAARRPRVQALAVHQLAAADLGAVVGLFAVLFYIPLFLQQAQGLGAFDAGLLLLPQALVMAVLHADRRAALRPIGPRWPAVIGLTSSRWAPTCSRHHARHQQRARSSALLALRAGGMGLAMMPIMTGGMAAVPPSEVGAASAFNNVAQRSSAALGLAVLTALMTSQQAAMLQDRTR